MHDTALPNLAGVEIGGRGRSRVTTERNGARGTVCSAAQEPATPSRREIAFTDRLPGYQERFRRRAEVMAQLQHPHICRVMEHGVTSVKDSQGRTIETEYLCLDLITGGSLHERLDGRAPFALEQIDRWIGVIAQALGYAHGLGVVHGDLKPSVVVFDEAGNPYLTDFALGRERSAEVVGTPAYMAPEQWTAGEIGPAVDQFSLAVLAYGMIAGAKPFEGQDNPDIRRRNFARGAIPVHEEARERRTDPVHPDVSDVINRGLSVEAVQRYPSVVEFATELSSALRGVSKGTETEGPPRVFFSYQRGAAAGWAVHIASQLRDRHGLDVFLDVQAIDAAAKFPERLTRAIHKADVFVCLLGPTTLESVWVKKEIALAHQRRKPMIPIFQENSGSRFLKQTTSPSPRSKPCCHTTASGCSTSRISTSNTWSCSSRTGSRTPFRKSDRRSPVSRTNHTSRYPRSKPATSRFCNARISWTSCGWVPPEILCLNRSPRWPSNSPFSSMSESSSTSSGSERWVNVSWKLPLLWVDLMLIMLLMRPCSPAGTLPR